MRARVFVAIAAVVLGAAVAAEAQSFGRRTPPPKRAETEGPESVGGYSLKRDAIYQAIADGKGREALAAYEAAASSAERDGDLVTAVRAGSAAASVALRTGQIQKVLTLGSRVLTLAPSAPASREICRSVLATAQTLASAYRAINDPAKGRAVLLEARAFSQAPANAPHCSHLTTYVAAIYEALAATESSAGDRVKGLEYAREAARVLDEALGRQGGDERGRRGLERRAAHASLQMASLIGDNNAQESAAALARAADLARRAGRAEKQGESVRNGDLRVRIAVAAAELALRRADAAQALQIALAARPEAQRSNPRRLLDLDRVIAHAHGKLGNHSDALVVAQRVLTRLEAARGDLQDPAQRAGLLERRQEFYRFAVLTALRLKENDEAFALSERARSRAFLDLLGSATLSKGRTSALAREESELRARLAEAAILTEQDDADDDEEPAPPAVAARRRIEAVEREYEAFLNRVRKESGEQASLMTVEPVTVAEVQTLLPKGAVLIEYFVTESYLVTWVIDGRRVDVHRVRLDRDALVAEVRSFRGAIAGHAPLGEIETRGRALFDMLLAPASKRLAGKRLVIVPHDVLHYLPFSALRSSAGRWLMEDHSLGTVPSASVLKFLVTKGANASDRVLAIGNPDLGPALALRYAEREVRAIGERHPAATVLTRGDASEKRVKQEASAAGLLHFAVHGELSETDPMSSALLLTPGGGEDGRFEVRELLAMELSAKLVVLSACETGLGKLSRGDELVGLQRAFFYAGTPVVVSTLWKVDDRASFTLMRAFYDGLRSTGPTDALRAAQRAQLVDSPHPFAWAAFGVTGAPR